jgi:hypothetical protein
MEARKGPESASKSRCMGGQALGCRQRLRSDQVMESGKLSRPSVSAFTRYRVGIKWTE